MGQFPAKILDEDGTLLGLQCEHCGVPYYKEDGNMDEAYECCQDSPQTQSRAKQI